MKVFVTGSSGFLGQALVQRLIEEGHQVRCLVRKKREDSYKKGTLEEHLGDINDQESLRKAIRGTDIAFHLAGVIDYKRKARKLLEKVNVDGTLNVVEACKWVGCNKLIYVSSVVTIGASFSGQEILNENSEFNLTKLNLGYYETKRKGEMFVLEAAKRGEINAVVVNPSTVYGWGDAQKNSRKVQVKVARGEMPFYPPGGISVVGVEDVIDGIINALSRGRNAERYILAGENLLIKDVFKMIAHYAGRSAPNFLLPNIALKSIGWISDVILDPLGIEMSINSEVASISSLYHWYDSSKAKKELQFEPQPALTAIEKSVEWMKSNGYLN